MANPSNGPLRAKEIEQLRADAEAWLQTEGQAFWKNVCDMAMPKWAATVIPFMLAAYATSNGLEAKWKLDSQRAEVGFNLKALSFAVCTAEVTIDRLHKELEAKTAELEAIKNSPPDGIWRAIRRRLNGSLSR